MKQPRHRLDRTLRALSDPTRREILEALRERDLAAGEIAARFPITPASVSHHLSVLRDAALVMAARNGRQVVYSLDSTVFQEVLREIMSTFSIGGEE